jgi:hypothetical protein
MKDIKIVSNIKFNLGSNSWQIDLKVYIETSNTSILLVIHKLLYKSIFEKKKFNVYFDVTLKSPNYIMLPTALLIPM